MEDITTTTEFDPATDLDLIIKDQQDSDMIAYLDYLNDQDAEMITDPTEYANLDMIMEDEEADLTYDHWREDRIDW